MLFERCRDLASAAVDQSAHSSHQLQYQLHFLQLYGNSSFLTSPFIKSLVFHLFLQLSILKNEFDKLATLYKENAVLQVY